MIDKGKRNILGILVDSVDYQAAVERVISAAQQKRALAVSALAVHGVMTGVLDSTHRYRLNSLDLVVPDGQPVRWALNLLYRIGLPDRVYGPTLMLKTCARAAEEGLPIYLYGSTQDVLSAISSNLCSRFEKLVIAGTQPSRFRQITKEEEEETISQIRNTGTAITFVGLGCPRQEVWVYENRKALSMPLLAVGAAFDFHAGALPQAPESLQRLGLEWVYRLLQEPRRLWKRYLFLNPLYLGLLFLQLARLRKFDPFRITPPTEHMRYG